MQKATYISHRLVQPDRRIKKYSCWATFKTEDGSIVEAEITVYHEEHVNSWLTVATAAQIEKTLIPYKEGKALVGYSCKYWTVASSMPEFVVDVSVRPATGLSSTREEAFNAAKETQLRFMLQELEKVRNATFKEQSVTYSHNTKNKVL